MYNIKLQACLFNLNINKLKLITKQNYQLANCILDQWNVKYFALFQKNTIEPKW
jgi:hypothetical protein